LTEIRCKVSDLLDICEIATLKGRNLQGKEYLAVPEFVIDAVAGEKPTLSITAANVDNTLALKLDYLISSVPEAGEIPIGDVEKFVKYLERFSPKDEINLKIATNRIVIERATPRKIERIPLTDVANIDTTSRGKEYFVKFSTTEHGYPKSTKSHLNLKIILNADEIKKVIEDGEVVNQRIYPFDITPEAFTVKVGSEQTGEIETSIPNVNLENDPEKLGSRKTKTCFAGGLDNIFGNISGPVTLYMLDDSELSPMYILKTDLKYTFKAFLAPVMPE
jgi:hypothetical protein